MFEALQHGWRASFHLVVPGFCKKRFSMAETALVCAAATR
jgi:hypothetical protein